MLPGSVQCHIYIYIYIDNAKFELLNLYFKFHKDKTNYLHSSVDKTQLTK